jgi:hypothetical protein
MNACRCNDDAYGFRSRELRTSAMDTNDMTMPKPALTATRHSFRSVPLSGPGLLLGVVGAVVSPSATAVTHCVDTVAELRAALVTAGTNGADDDIRINTGVYAPTDGVSGSAFQYASSENFALTISGGWTNFIGPCDVRFNGAHSTIDGLDARRPLRINPGTGSGNMTVSHLTLINGNTTGEGGGLFIGTDAYTGSLMVDSMIIANNAADTRAGGISMRSSTRAELRNSVLYNNGAGIDFGAALFAIDEPAPTGIRMRLANNTIVANGCLPGAPTTCETGGVRFEGTAKVAAYNNAFHDNTGFDIHNLSAALDLAGNNLMLPVKGSPPNSIAQNITVAAPRFINSGPLFGRFELQENSPLRDAGSLEFLLPPDDIIDRDRIHGFTVDIGAYELDTFSFKHGFEDPPTP